MSRIQRGRNRLGQVVHMKSDKFQVERLGRVNFVHLEKFNLKFSSSSFVISLIYKIDTHRN